MLFIILFFAFFLIFSYFRYKELRERFDALEKDLAALKRRFATHEATAEKLKQPDSHPSSAVAAEAVKSAPTPSTYVDQTVHIPPFSAVSPAASVSPMSTEILSQPDMILSSAGQTGKSVPHRPEGIEIEEVSPTRPVFESKAPTSSSTEIKWHEFKNNVDWEQFTGIKLFAWLGGFALFIGAIFFVKYSIDNNLIPPELRLVIGALIGLMMIISSLFIDRERYDTTVHTMAAGGIAVLYAVAFTASVYYGFIPKMAGFASFAMISAAAFALAVLYNGRFISVLGAIGAYSTPLLIQTGHPNLIGLFIYLSLVNVGLFEVIRRTGWYPLTVLVTLGTLLTLSAGAWGTQPPSDNDLITIIAIANLLIFSLFFCIYRGQNPANQSLVTSVRIIFLSMFLLALSFINTDTPVIWLPLLLVTVSILTGLVISYQEKSWSVGFTFYNIIGFLIVALWSYLNFDLTKPSWDMMMFFIYGFIASLGPIFVIRKHGIEPDSLQWLKVFPAALVAVGFAILLKSDVTSFYFWPILLSLSIIGIFAGLIVGSILSVVALCLLLLATGIHWILRMPVLHIGNDFFLFILIAGILLSFVTMLFLKKSSDWNPLAGEKEVDSVLTPDFINSSSWISALPVLCPFILIAIILLRQYPVDPNLPMSTALCFFAVALFVSRWIKSQEILVAALVAMTVTFLSWGLFSGIGMDNYRLLLYWSSFFWFLALIIPLIIFRPEEEWKIGWFAWAVFELIQSLLIIRTADILWTRNIAGWIPLGMAAFKLPVIAVLLQRLEDKNERNAILAFHGGVFLFYISAVPVLLFDTAWLGLTAVLEATLLLLLNRRIEHPGLRWVALCLAPIGLFLLFSNINALKGPQDMPVLNFAVLNFALCTLALGISVKLADYPQEELTENFSLPRYFLWFAVGTGFFLLNLIISDIFGGVGGFKTDFYNDINQYIAYALLWTFFGALLWRTSSKTSASFSGAGLLILIVGSFMTFWLPFYFYKDIGRMTPFFNLALVIFVPSIAAMFYLAIAQTEEDLYGEDIKQLFITIGLALGLLAVTVQLSTIFDNGRPFDLFARQTSSMTLALIISWFIFGLGLVLWPSHLHHAFRLTGTIVMIISLIRGVFYPLIYSLEFGAVIPILNMPTLIFMAMIIGFLILTIRRFPEEWSWKGEFLPRHMWATLLILFAFYVMNVEVASVFGKFRTGIDSGIFSFYTHGRLSQQLAYSISWLVYAIGLLIIGINWKIIQVRWVALALFVITALKVFIKDLWTLGQLYRVFSFVGLAITLMLVSFLYQRYLGSGKSKSDLQ